MWMTALAVLWFAGPIVAALMMAVLCGGRGEAGLIAAMRQKALKSSEKKAEEKGAGHPYRSLHEPYVPCRQAERLPKSLWELMEAMQQMRHELDMLRLEIAKMQEPILELQKAFKTMNRHVDEERDER